MGTPPPILRPENSIGGGLPHERTALAWERTSIAMMVAGVAFARHASREAHLLLSGVGVAKIVAGAALLVWAAKNDRMLHDPALPANVVPQTGLTRVIGISTTVFTAVSLGLAVAVILA